MGEEQSSARVPAIADQLAQAEAEYAAASAKLEQLRAAAGVSAPTSAPQNIPTNQTGFVPNDAAAQAEHTYAPHAATQTIPPTGAYGATAPAGNPYAQATPMGATQTSTGTTQAQSIPYSGAPSQGVPAGYATKDHVAAGLLAIFLGTLGIHKFYLGYNTAGFIMLAVTIIGGLFIGLGVLAMFVVSIIEGILYLTKSQTEFEQTYLLQQRQWF